MDYRKIKGLDQAILPISLGTWSFGGDSWWGPQEDANSVAVLDKAISSGITLIDTAPIYGKGRSERIIGAFIRKRKLRERVVLATKVGLSWEGPKILHNLSKKRILEEVDISRKRLETDYFDLYQVHWPDSNIPIGETAEVIYELYQRRIIKSIGVSNHSVAQMREFMKYAPLHCLQPEYSMFNRGIEEEIIPFCLKNNIAVIAYAPLYSGLLTGKFFFDKVSIPNDTNRKMKKRHLREPLFSINKEALSQLKTIAVNYKKTLTQLAINWNFSQKGVTSTIVGMRNLEQVKDNLGGLGWTISEVDMQKINKILTQRQGEIEGL
ncbi:MAG: aldo/keto reductase [Candidatus Omnitrophica bacterium]|nr:aldo/keto reductase [Candidatus Omnitrophota bacterium]